MFTLRSLDSSKIRISFLTAVLAVATPFALSTPTRAATVAAPQEDEAVYQGEAPYRYASVKVLEGDVRIRKGDADETLSRGMPIAEGDVVDSRGRGVLQLGDGTRVAFGRNTRFTVAALFTEKDGSRQVLLRLDSGSLRVNYGADSEGRIRVDTPSGSASMDGRANMTIQVASDRSVKVHVASGRITFSNDRDQARILAGERLTIYSGQDRLDRVRSYNTYDQDDFDTWSDNYLVARRSASWDHVPADVRYYSDDLDDNGSWVDVPEVGWAWRPRVGYDDWRPYSRGRWGAYSGGMTWVSDEPWGYLTYHYGRWGWGAGLGWYWLPGSYYSPAWVAWNYTGNYYGWAPLGYYNQPCGWGYGAWNGYHCWNVVNVNYINASSIHGRLISDHNVIVRMSGGTGITTWNSGGRSLRPPWRTTPLIATRTEFRNPGQLGTAFNRTVAHDRMTSYQRGAQASTGRTVNLVPSGSRDHAATRIPFENRTAPGATGRGVISTDRTPTRFVDRPNPGGSSPSRTTTPLGVRTLDRPRDTGNGRTTRPVDPSSGLGSGRTDRSDRTERPIERPVDRPNNRSREDASPAPRDRNQDRPREIYRDERPVTPRDRPVERPAEHIDRYDRPLPREQSPAPRRESTPAPREYHREERIERSAPRQESQPSRQESRPSRQESQPAPRQESRPSAPQDSRRSVSRRG